MKTQSKTSDNEWGTLEAEPEVLQVDWRKAAVIVIDMQNCFVSKGGMLDLSGADIRPHAKVVKLIAEINRGARIRGVKVVYVAHIYSPDFRDSGGPDSPNPRKEHALRLWETHPEWRDRLLVRGTWGSQIVDKLKPQEGDIFVEKRRYNAFFGTDLDIILRTYAIKFLVFVGVATNICVETSVREAFHLDYFPILISDATIATGPPGIQEATIHNIKTAFGWVTTSANVLKALKT